MNFRSFYNFIFSFFLILNLFLFSFFFSQKEESVNSINFVKNELNTTIDIDSQFSKNFFIDISLDSLLEMDSRLLFGLLVSHLNQFPETFLNSKGFTSLIESNFSNLFSDLTEDLIKIKDLTTERDDYTIDLNSFYNLVPYNIEKINQLQMINLLTCFSQFSELSTNPFLFHYTLDYNKIINETETSYKEKIEFCFEEQNFSTEVFIHFDKIYFSEGKFRISLILSYFILKIEDFQKIIRENSHQLTSFFSTPISYFKKENLDNYHFKTLEKVIEFSQVINNPNSFFRKILDYFIDFFFLKNQLNDLECYSSENPQSTVDYLEQIKLQREDQEYLDFFCQLDYEESFIEENSSKNLFKFVFHLKEDFQQIVVSKNSFILKIDSEKIQVFSFKKEIPENSGLTLLGDGLSNPNTFNIKQGLQSLSLFGVEVSKSITFNQDEFCTQSNTKIKELQSLNLSGFLNHLNLLEQERISDKSEDLELDRQNAFTSLIGFIDFISTVNSIGDLPLIQTRNLFNLISNISSCKGSKLELTFDFFKSCWFKTGSSLEKIDEQTLPLYEDFKEPSNKFFGFINYFLENYKTGYSCVYLYPLQISTNSTVEVMESTSSNNTNYVGEIEEEESNVIKEENVSFSFFSFVSKTSILFFLLVIGFLFLLWVIYLIKISLG